MPKGPINWPFYLKEDNQILTSESFSSRTGIFAVDLAGNGKKDPSEMIRAFMIKKGWKKEEEATSNQSSIGLRMWSISGRPLQR